MRKVAVVITARRSYARIKTVLEAIERHPELELQLIVGASALLDRYGSVVDVIRADGFEPVAEVYMLIEGENPVTAAKSTGLGIIELATLFGSLEPDIVVSVADRYETMATAVAASYVNIPVAHVQGGEITGSIDEKVRHAVTKLSNLHFVASDVAAERVIRMGEHPDRVFAYGCPSVDLAERMVLARDTTPRFNPFESGVGHAFSLDDGYLMVLQHPVTTDYTHALEQIRESLAAIHSLGLPTLWFWPNVDAGSDQLSKGIRQFRENHDVPFLYFLKNVTPENFLQLLDGCDCLVGNSSVGIRECSFLGVPVVNIGDRQQGRDRGPNVIDVDYQRNAIAEAIQHWIETERPLGSTLYGDGHAGARIAEELATAPLEFKKTLEFHDPTPTRIALELELEAVETH